MDRAARWRRIAKFLVALLIPVAQTAQAALTDGTITGNEWTKIGMALVGVALVYLVPNQLPPVAAPTLFARSPEQERRARRYDLPEPDFPPGESQTFLGKRKDRPVE